MTQKVALITGGASGIGKSTPMILARKGINETKTIGDSDTAKFQAMLRTNVMGVYLCMKYEIEQMLKAGGGSIVNLASIGGLNGIFMVRPLCCNQARRRRPGKVRCTELRYPEN